MIQPLPSNDTESGDIPLDVVEKKDNNKIVEYPDQKSDDSSEDSFDPDQVKFIASPFKKYNRSTLRKAAARNSLNIEISPVYQVIFIHLYSKYSHHN